MPLKIGVFGGTFDPPHLGHLVTAQEVVYQLALDRLLMIPAAIPPHKSDRDISPGETRLSMVRAAVAGVPRLEVSDLEIQRLGPSYTVDTLRYLRRQYWDARLFLVVGADQLVDFETWKEPEEIVGLATIVAIPRSGADLDECEGLLDAVGGMVQVEVPRIDISGTVIRRRVAGGEPIGFLVLPSVKRLIELEKLYR